MDPRLLPGGRLRHGSPCIDAGNNAAIPGGITTDVSGRPRFIDDPETVDTGNPGSPTRPVVDMGACEYEPVPAKQIYVKSTAEPGGDGQSWTTAFQFLQDALLSDDPGVTEIWVAGGIYTPDRDAGHPGGSGVRSAAFLLPGGVVIYGGFPGAAGQEGDASVRNPAGYATILTGDLAGNDAAGFANNSENSYQVVRAIGVGPETILDGFTVSGANSAGSMSYSGAGMYCSGCSLKLANCIFTGNVSGPSISGGGLYISGGSPTLIQCVFVGNSAGAGGGIYNNRGNPALINCTITGNSIGTAGYGGGLYNYIGTLSLTNCIVWGNGASQLYQTGGTATITYSCVQGISSGQGNIIVDPRLLADGRLRRGSPCIDAGANAALPTAITADLAGNSRFVDDPETADTGDPGDPPAFVVDMGAYEYQPVSAKRLYVKRTAAAGGDGQSWATAYPFLQDGLTAAQSDPAVTEVWVASGVYTPDQDSAHVTGSGNRAATFQLLGGITVYGGFAGQPGEEGNLNSRNPAAYPTVLSGDLAANDGPSFANNIENSYHVVTTSSIGSAAILDGVSIMGGNANGTSPNDAGGALYNFNASPMLRKCILRANAASASGAAVYNYASNPIFTNCILAGNLTGTTGYGGAVNSVSNSRPTVTNCTVFGNSAKYGGGFYSSGGSVPTLKNCILWANTATIAGAQVYGSATITFSCVEGGWTGAANIDMDPLFVADDGPRLRPGSPCIDAGNNTAVPEGVTTDLDGQARFRNDPATADCRWAPGTCGAGPIVDMGAYEYVPGDFDRDGDIDGDDAAAFLDCALGPAVPCTGDCIKADLDGDGDVDQADFGILQPCYSGAGRPVDPRCTAD